jgi:hypothetical protein
MTVITSATERAFLRGLPGPRWQPRRLAQNVQVPRQLANLALGSIDLFLA